MQPFHLKQLVIAALLAIAPGMIAQSSTKPQPVPLPSSELRRFHSDIMEQDFQIFVQLPLDYVSDGSKQYPVMYVTDGNRSFPIYANISTMLGFPPGNFPQVIVVGIAYDIKDMSQWAAWRTRDLTPTANKGDEQYWEGLLRRMTGDTTIRVETGGAPRFLSFICDELVPYIESEYRVSDQGRALAGYSFGGLEDPNGIAAVKEMAGVLESRNYPGLDVRTQVFEGEWHGSAGPGSIMRAFINLYGE